MVAKGCVASLKVASHHGRLPGENCYPQPDRGNPAVRDETGGRRNLTEARNEAPAISDEEPVTATPRCPPIQRLRSIPTRMREFRLSGSVEGVMSNHDPYSDLSFSQQE